MKKFGPRGIITRIILILFSLNGLFFLFLSTVWAIKFFSESDTEIILSTLNISYIVEMLFAVFGVISVNSYSEYGRR